MDGTCISVHAVLNIDVLICCLANLAAGGFVLHINLIG